MSSDPAAAALAQIKDDHIDAYAEDNTSPVPRLLAAVEAALKQHPPIRADGGNSDELLCDKCSFAYRTPWPCGEVAAITAALTGQEAGGGGV
jgi:hypothetical protein